MAGAHLDSVEAGPGINDNGRGTRADRVDGVCRRPVLPAAAGHRAVPDFGMIGSPNAAYFVYDGDDSDGVGAGPDPYGSAQIEQAFVDYLASIDVPPERTDFSGRSDYGPFIAVGISSGGLFTGVEGIKTEDRPPRGAVRRARRRPVLPPGLRQTSAIPTARRWTATVTPQHS